MYKPVTAFICEMLPERVRETSDMELMYEDIWNLPIYDMSIA